MHDIDPMCFPLIYYLERAVSAAKGVGGGRCSTFILQVPTNINYKVSCFNSYRRMERMLVRSGVNSTALHKVMQLDSY